MLAAADRMQKASNSREYQTSFFIYKLFIGITIWFDGQINTELLVEPDQNLGINKIPIA